MAQQIVDRRDQDFVIWEQMQCDEILAHNLYAEFNRKTCDMIITEARALALKEVLPTLKDGDEQGVGLENGTVKVPDSFHRVFDLILEGDWQNLSVPVDMGGAGCSGLYRGRRGRVFSGGQLGALLLCDHG